MQRSMHPRFRFIRVQRAVALDSFINALMMPDLAIADIAKML
jgi:hypothetical protein